MPLCHNCEYNGKADSHCLDCAGPSDTPYNKGKTHLSIDAGDVQTLGAVAASRQKQQQNADIDAQAAELDEASVEFGMHVGALRVIQYFCDLDPAEVSLILMSLHNNLANIGRECGLTRAAISLRMQKIVEKHPELKGITKWAKQ